MCSPQMDLISLYGTQDKFVSLQNLQESSILSPRHFDFSIFRYWRAQHRLSSAGQLYRFPGQRGSIRYPCSIATAEKYYNQRRYARKNADQSLKLPATPNFYCPRETFPETRPQRQRLAAFLRSNWGRTSCTSSGF